MIKKRFERMFLKPAIETVLVLGEPQSRDRIQSYIVCEAYSVPAV